MDYGSTKNITEVRKSYPTTSPHIGLQPDSSTGYIRMLVYASVCSAHLNSGAYLKRQQREAYAQLKRAWLISTAAVRSHDNRSHFRRPDFLLIQLISLIWLVAVDHPSCSNFNYLQPIINAKPPTRISYHAWLKCALQKQTCSYRCVSVILWRSAFIKYAKNDVSIQNILV